MTIVKYTDMDDVAAECVATVGFFDGVHRGHRYLIKQVKEEAERLGAEAVVVTFDRHPRHVIGCDYRPRMLNTLDEKTALLESTGIDRCVILPFDEAMSRLSARDFMSGVLRERIGVKILVTGYDNRFGRNRSEGFDEYVRHGVDIGMDVVLAKPLILNGVSVSSSVIRSFIEAGEVEMAALCLNSHYSMTGCVVDGEHVGRGLGFPTANIEPDDADKIIPATGVYAVWVEMDGEPVRYHAMMNIGFRPTFGGNRRTLEVHILNFSGDIYGRRISVSFVGRLRTERKFHGAAELAAQLREDARLAVEILEEDVKKQTTDIRL